MSMDTSTAAQVVGQAAEPAPRPPRRALHLGDRIFAGVARFFALLVLALPFAMGLELVRASSKSIAAFGVGFLTGTTWDPVHERFGALPFVYGTVVSSLIALAIAVPVSLGVAIFLSELAPSSVRKPLGFLVELLAAVPSVIYGFWGIFVLVPFVRDHVEPLLASTLGFLPLFQGPPLGFGMLSAGIVLAIMIVPTITSITREVLRAIPDLYREAAVGLGATRWEAIRHAVLPCARSGIVGAIILGLGRALGETMAVTMVIGNRPQISASLFAPAYSMASAIANEFTEADRDVYLSALSELALLLLLVALVLNLLARWLVSSGERRMKRRAA